MAAAEQPSARVWTGIVRAKLVVIGEITRLEFPWAPQATDSLGPRVETLGSHSVGVTADVGQQRAVDRLAAAADEVQPPGPR